MSENALTRTEGMHDAKNPYPAPIRVARELFQSTVNRNCVHVEFNTEGSDLTYEHGDHVGVWASNPDLEVVRLLCALGLYNKKDKVIGVDSLDPALAQVPFPVPTTYETVFRHYIDINAVAGRQILGKLSPFAPTPEAEHFLKNLHHNKEEYRRVITNGCFKLGEVLQLAAGDDLRAFPTPENTTAWTIPFDVIVSAVPRLQPRYYSISSSPKLYPNAIHATVVVLKYESAPIDIASQRWLYGVGSNFVLNLKLASTGQAIPAFGQVEASKPSVPSYHIEGPRGAHKQDQVYKVPIHVRRSTFRLPTNPSCPVIMVGPGTVSFHSLFIFKKSV